MYPDTCECTHIHPSVKPSAGSQKRNAWSATVDGFGNHAATSPNADRTRKTVNPTRVYDIIMAAGYTLLVKSESIQRSRVHSHHPWVKGQHINTRQQWRRTYMLKLLPLPTINPVPIADPTPVDQI